MATQSSDRWTLNYKELGTGPVPTEPYVAKDYFEREREKIFKHTWLNVGRVEEIPEAGITLSKQSQSGRSLSGYWSQGLNLFVQ